MSTNYNLWQVHSLENLEFMNISFHLKAICWFRCSHFKEFLNRPDAFLKIRVTNYN